MMAEIGFHHPDRGYWQAIGGDPDELMETYPEGTEQVPLRPGQDYEWQDGQWVEVDPPPPTNADLSTAVQAHLDAKAQERPYRDVQALASYVLSENAMRRTEARAFLSWRDQVWGYALPELQKMRDGERSVPTIEDFLTELPAFEWPSEPESIRHTEVHTGVTNASGQVAITFNESFSEIPHVSPEMLPAPDAFSFVQVTAVSESGATIAVRRRQGLEVLGLTLLSAATTPVAGVNVSIQATGV